jgi:diguanylate cyclase (GGDEF)-like protein
MMGFVPDMTERRTRILVVDDEDSTRTLVRDHLVDAGFEVLTAGSGSEAVQVLTSSEVSIVITDWLMPELDGLELCRRIKGNEALGTIFLIVLTVQTEPQHIEEAFEAGADDFIPKPFVREELLARIRNGLRFLGVQNELAQRTREALRYADEVAVANQRLHWLATTDGLTGLLNRREGLRQLDAYWHSTLKNGRPLSVLLCDVDHFKTINDTHGHDAGDCVLKEMALRLKKALRPGDSLCRWGGEEFLVTCPAASAEVASRVADALRTSLAARSIRLPSGELSATLSIGVAERDGENRTIETLLRSADAALYQAKASGRDRVVAATASGAT